jgi:alpha-galactosidase
MGQETRRLLTNPHVIAINQDWAGMQGRKITDRGDVEVWAKPMSSGEIAVAFLNRGAHPVRTAVTASDLGLPEADVYAVRDAWSGGTNEQTGRVRAAVPAHGVRLLVVHASGGGG